VIAKILVALGALIAFAALVIALADNPIAPPAPGKPPGLCKDKPNHKLKPDQEDRCNR